jgi:hypothetical protein
MEKNIKKKSGFSNLVEKFTPREIRQFLSVILISGYSLNATAASLYCDDKKMNVTVNPSDDLKEARDNYMLAQKIDDKCRDEKLSYSDSEYHFDDGGRFIDPCNREAQIWNQTHKHFHMLRFKEASGHCKKININYCEPPMGWGRHNCTIKMNYLVRHEK